VLRCFLGFRRKDPEQAGVATQILCSVEDVEVGVSLTVQGHESPDSGERVCFLELSGETFDFIGETPGVLDKGLGCLGGGSHDGARV
jgi:hypothetical protein